MTTVRKQYTQAEKDEFIAKVEEGIKNGRSVDDVATDLGMRSNAFYVWRRERDNIRSPSRRPKSQPALLTLPTPQVLAERTPAPVSASRRLIAFVGTPADVLSALTGLGV